MKTKLINTASGMEVRIWEGEEPTYFTAPFDITESQLNDLIEQYLSSYKSYPVRSEDEERFWDLAFDTYCFNNKLDNSNLPSADEIDVALSQGIEIPSERVKLMVCCLKDCTGTCGSCVDMEIFATLLPEDKEGEGQGELVKLIEKYKDATNELCKLICLGYNNEDLIKAVKRLADLNNSK